MKTWLLVLYGTLAVWVECSLSPRTSPIEARSAIASVDITKTTNWVDTSNVVGFTVTLLASQVIIASGWIIFGTLWYLMAVTTSEKSDIHRNVMLFEFMLEPQFVIGNVFRCMAIFAFLFFAIVFKTVLTIGLTDTMHYFSTTTRTEATGMVTSEKFIRQTLVRTFANGFFLLIGWTMVAIVVKKKLFLIADESLRKSKMIKRSAKSTTNLVEDYCITEMSIEAGFCKLLAKMS